MSKALADKVLPKRLNDEIERLLDANVQIRANPENGTVSKATRKERRQVVRMSYAQLWTMGYRLQNAQSLRERHIRALVARWDDEGVVAGTLRTRISYLSTFAGWMGKAGMVKSPDEYCSSDRIKRTVVAQENKSWQANKVSPEEVMRKAMEIDERLALVLALQSDFGMRVKESIEFRPLDSITDDGRTVELFQGTKGGRRRAVPIENEAQRRTIAWAIEVAKNTHGGRMRWPGKSWPQAQTYFYSLMRRKLKISRKDAGVTAHGLRHGYGQGNYCAQTGHPTPVDGGAISVIDWETHTKAAKSVSRKLGHARLVITGTYIGSYGHGLRTAKALDPKTSVPDDDAEEHGNDG